MSATTEPERQSFAETALRLGGKSDDEARRLGAVDKADEQVEALFAQRYQTPRSPIHKAIWEDKVPLDLFQPAPVTGAMPCDPAMERSIAVVKRRREQGKLLDERNKTSNESLKELAESGYWGMLIEPR